MEADGVSSADLDNSDDLASMVVTVTIIVTVRAIGVLRIVMGVLMEVIVMTMETR